MNLQTILQLNLVMTVVCFLSQNVEESRTTIEGSERIV